MEKITVSFATAEDIDQCNFIDKVMGFLTEPTIQQEAIIANRLLIATVETKVAGYLRYGYIWDGKLPYIQMIRVTPEYRRKAVGRKLIEALEDRLRKQGIRYLLSSTDETNTTSIQFHKALGFQECGTLDINEDGKLEIFLRKKLTK